MVRAKVHFACQLVMVKVIRESDANETSGEDGLALLGNLVGESQLRIPKFEPDIMFSNMLPLLSVELEYHAEWCALQSLSISISVVIIRWSREQGRNVTSCARSCWECVDVGNDQLRISKLGRNGQLLQVRFCQSLWRLMPPREVY